MLEGLPLGIEGFRVQRRPRGSEDFRGPPFNTTQVQGMQRWLDSRNLTAGKVHWGLLYSGYVEILFSIFGF